MVSDRGIKVECSVTAAAAWVLWSLSTGLCLVAWGTKSIDLGMLSLLVCGAAVTMTIRVYFITLGRKIKAALIVAATEGAESTVRSLR